LIHTKHQQSSNERKSFFIPTIKKLTLPLLFHLHLYLFSVQKPKLVHSIIILKITLDGHFRVLYSAQYMKTAFGKFIRGRREALKEKDRRYSLRQVATRIGIEPSLLSRVERGEPSSLSELKITRLAKDLEEDADVLLALSGKVSSDIQEIIRKRPQLFAQLIRDLKKLPDHAVLRIVREVRDGKW
jgi:HTH-type transcriptional regulator, competence development regulator